MPRNTKRRFCTATRQLRQQAAQVFQTALIAGAPAVFQCVIDEFLIDLRQLRQEAIEGRPIVGIVFCENCADGMTIAVTTSSIV